MRWVDEGVDVVAGGREQFEGHRQESNGPMALGLPSLRPYIRSGADKVLLKSVQGRS